MIQLSSNSNEALRLVIASRPTAIGQYRQAYMQYIDRVSALRACEFNLRRISAKLKLKAAEKNQIKELIEQELNPNRILAYEANIELLDIDTEELMSQTQELTEQIDDAQREAVFCKSVMDQIVQEVGIDFSSLTTEEFQHYMIEETKQFQSRKLAAGVLSRTTGLSPSVTEALLDLPPEDLVEMLKLQGDILEKYNKNVLAPVEESKLLPIKEINPKNNNFIKLQSNDLRLQ